ncbi:hypothetical protein MRB53_032917 [Persea americana]|uniref:Uncharacterized protein n=1 Tax=Persea americana TaxID=3435 RepID=A0ACC2KT82_PERAE|nr:hypothetical protein MRB53_032917 [Persea americana]
MSLTGKIPESMGTDEEVKRLDVGIQIKALSWHLIKFQVPFMDKDADLSVKIKEGFGPSGLGIISVSDLPCLGWFFSGRRMFLCILFVDLVAFLLVLRLYVLQFHCLLACLPLLFPYEIDQKGSIRFCAGYMFCNFIACLRASLFFFHMKLIRNGITIYEYVVAMRAMSEAPAGSIDDDNQNVIYSPSGSATTGFSGGSSLGLQYKGAWCTPPRVFVDHQLRTL